MGSIQWILFPIVLAVGLCKLVIWIKRKIFGDI